MTVINFWFRQIENSTIQSPGNRESQVKLGAYRNAALVLGGLRAVLILVYIFVIRAVSRVAILFLPSW